MQVLEVRPVTAAAETLVAVVLRWLLDLDDIRPPVGELAHGGRPGTNP
jgi:hypothetical protein